MKEKEIFNISNIIFACRRALQSAVGRGAGRAEVTAAAQLLRASQLWKRAPKGDRMPETDCRPRERARTVKAVSPSLPTSTAVFMWIRQPEDSNTMDLLQIDRTVCPW